MAHYANPAGPIAIIIQYLLANNAEYSMGTILPHVLTLLGYFNFYYYDAAILDCLDFEAWLSGGLTFGRIRLGKLRRAYFLINKAFRIRSPHQFMCHYRFENLVDSLYDCESHRQIMIAVCMGLHTRLGRDSLVRVLSSDILRFFADHPQWLCNEADIPPRLEELFQGTAGDVCHCRITDVV